MAGLIEGGGELLERRRRPGLGAERGDHLLAREVAGLEQLRPGPLLGAELAEPQLTAVGEADEHPRAAVAERGTLVEDLQAPGRHHVDEQDELAPVAELDHGHLPDPADAVQGLADDRVQRRFDALQGDHPRSERGLDLGAFQGRLDATRGDLDLGQLRHRARVDERANREWRAGADR